MISNNKIVLLSDDRVRKLKVIDNGEKFVDLLKEDTGLHIDHTRSQIGNHTIYYASIRKSVAERLQIAEKALPSQISLLIKECFRPISLQQMFYDSWLHELAIENPNWTSDQLEHEASAYVAPADIAPHSTGGALDLTLIDESKNELDMGTVFNANPIRSCNAIEFMASNITDSARNNRNILKSAMEAAGFVNYPTEWWHWSYGDRYWTHCTNNKYALYGSVEKPIY